MNATGTVVLSGVVVTAGRWSQGKALTMRIIVGGTVLMLFLAAMNEANEDLAGKFALLVLAASVLTYGVDIAKKTGLAK